MIVELILVSLIVYPVYKLCKCAPKTTYDMKYSIDGMRHFKKQDVRHVPKATYKPKRSVRFDLNNSNYSKKELQTIYEYANLCEYDNKIQTPTYDYEY
jgi:hypothetical protein